MVLKKDFGDLTETTVKMEEKVNEASSKIDKSEINFHQRISMLENQIRQYQQTIVDLQALIPRQIAFKKRLSFNCGTKCNHPMLEDRMIGNYSEMEYGIGIENDTSGYYEIKVSGIYEVRSKSYTDTLIRFNSLSLKLKFQSVLVETEDGKTFQ